MGGLGLMLIWDEDLSFFCDNVPCKIVRVVRSEMVK